MFEHLRQLLLTATRPYSCLTLLLNDTCTVQTKRWNKCSDRLALLFFFTDQKICTPARSGNHNQSTLGSEWESTESHSWFTLCVLFYCKDQRQIRQLDWNPVQCGCQFLLLLTFISMFTKMCVNSCFTHVYRFWILYT